MPTQQQLNNLKAVVPFAQASAKKWGVPASITLAQWIVESSWGQSKLATSANNCFGIKAVNLQGLTPYVEMSTHEYESGQRKMVVAHFTKYPSVEASFDAHARLLATAPRYAPCRAAVERPTAYAAALYHCGYSTNPTYSGELISLMHAYNLMQYDVPPDEPAAQLAA